MNAVQESIIVEQSRLDAAFQRLANAVENYGHSAEEKARLSITTALQSEIETLKDEMRQLTDRGVEAKNEVSRLSAELVRSRDENRKLKELNGKVAELLSKSITELEVLTG